MVINYSNSAPFLALQLLTCPSSCQPKFVFSVGRCLTSSLKIPLEPQILNSDFQRILSFLTCWLSLKSANRLIHFIFFNIFYILCFILFIKYAKGYFPCHINFLFVQWHKHKNIHNDTGVLPTVIQSYSQQNLSTAVKILNGVVLFPYSTTQHSISLINTY